MEVTSQREELSTTKEVLLPPLVHCSITASKVYSRSRLSSDLLIRQWKEECSSQGLWYI